ncbi:hypothetical protein EV424DRAFT_1402929 [Suillus variegatus]|nr:hypothetical protein EV424DRAFT_1402929 [Suillus variegatus]
MIGNRPAGFEIYGIITWGAKGPYKVRGTFDIRRSIMLRSLTGRPLIGMLLYHGAAPCSILVPPYDSLLNMDSPTFIHLSTILQTQNYFFGAIISAVYDCFLILDQEVSLIHRPRWSKGTILYIVTRYMPALMLSTCKILQSMWYCKILTGSPGIFILRTYALWGQNKFILGLMLSTGLSLIILNMVIALKVWKQSKRKCLEEEPHVNRSV